MSSPPPAASSSFLWSLRSSQVGNLSSDQPVILIISHQFNDGNRERMKELKEDHRHSLLLSGDPVFLWIAAQTRCFCAFLSSQILLFCQLNCLKTPAQTEFRYLPPLSLPPPLSSRTLIGQQLNLSSTLKTCSWPTNPLAVLPAPTSSTCFIPILMFHQHGSESVRSFLHTYQSDNGTLGSELCSAEKGPDEAVDLFLLRVVFVVIRRNLQLLHHK